MRQDPQVMDPWGRGYPPGLRTQGRGFDSRWVRFCDFVQFIGDTSDPTGIGARKTDEENLKVEIVIRSPE